MIALYVGIYRVALRLHRRSAAKRERSIACLVSMAGGTVTHIGSVIGMTRQATSSTPDKAAVVGRSVHIGGEFWPKRKRKCAADVSTTPAAATGGETRSEDDDRVDYDDGTCSPASGATFGGRSSVRFDGRLYEPCSSSPGIFSSSPPTPQIGNGNLPTTGDCDERRVAAGDGRCRRNLRLNLLRAERFRYRNAQHETIGRLSSSGFGSTSTAMTTAPNTASPNPTKVCRFDEGADTILLFDTDDSDSLRHPMTSSPDVSSPFMTSQYSRKRTGRSSLFSNGVDDGLTARSDRESETVADDADRNGNFRLEETDRSVSDRLASSKTTSQIRRTLSQTNSCGCRNTRAATAVSGRPEDLEEMPYFDDADDDDDVFHTGEVHSYSLMCASDTQVLGQRSITGTAGAGYSEDETDFPCDVITDDDIEMVSASEWRKNETNVGTTEDNEMESTSDKTIARCEHDATLRRNCWRSESLLQPSAASERRALLPVTTSLRPSG